jgi:hypothetical protein
VEVSSDRAGDAGPLDIVAKRHGQIRTVVLEPPLVREVLTGEKQGDSRAFSGRTGELGRELCAEMRVFFGVKKGLFSGGRELQVVLV